MVLSITGTVCTVMVQQYKFSARAAIINKLKQGTRLLLQTLKIFS